MTLRARSSWVVPAALLIVVSGCLELTGQRITMRYDQAADRLAFLLQYDGIHNSEKSNTSPEQAEKQLREFVENDDSMLFDWFGHIQPVEIRKELQSEMPPRLQALGDLFLASYRETVLGHYRDRDGRVGVAQLVTLDHASRLVAAGNAAISEAILAEPAADVAWGRTLERWKSLAAEGHPWLSLDGQSLVWKCSVDSGEWARGKLRFLADLSRAWKAQGGGGPSENFGHRLLAAAPLSLSQEGEEITVRLGRMDAPTTLRVQWRDSYLPNVEPTVVEIVPTDLDQRLAACLLDGEQPDPALAQLIAWGPAEERVRAVLGRASSGTERQRREALVWLEEFGTEWNAHHRAPEAPGADGDEAAYFARWEPWYRAIVEQP